MNKHNIEFSESSRLWATKLLREFRASGSYSYTFDNSLTNEERGVLHLMCRKMGFRSKSSGKRNQRRLTIFKRVNRNGDGSEKKKLKCVSFPPEAKPVVEDLFTRYPPCEGDTAATSVCVYTGQSGKQRKRNDDFFSRPLMKKDDILKKAASLRSRLANDIEFRKIFAARTKLPIASFREAITSAVESNQVVLIAGETGCGKTTQVPQYLLDHMWYNKRESCKIICAQPRRISAISVSERIACERGETIGKNVGFKVRLKSQGGRESSVVFCTNGILLRVLVGKGAGSCVPDITHIIVDEIHERDCNSDFILAIVRDFLPSNPHLRLILMSATLDAERFSGYFGGCPVVRVPGFTYPVRTFYLEDVLSVLKSEKNHHLIPDGKRDIKDEDKVALDEAIEMAWTNDEFEALLDLVSSGESHEVYNYRQTSTWLTPLMVFAGKGRVNNVYKLLALGADCKLRSKEGMTALELAEKENQFEAAQIIREHTDNAQSNSQQEQVLLDKYMETIRPEEVDVGLIVNLMRKLCGDSEAGAVLVFLPGWDEISKTKDKLLANPYFADSAKYIILCLHSRVPVEEQKKVFERPRKGCRKIVLATNIAESAVTIDDVVYVIDSGRMKEKSYDPYNDVSTLESSWVSKANAKQREGRAGRCQPGICYHLYSKLRAASLPEYRIPEVRRMPVDELCLQVKILYPRSNVNDFLQKMLDPPVDKSIANALTTLQDIGALTPQQELTELGQKFGQLPVHPRICKMLYFSILVSCLDPALILACSVDAKDPFTMPSGPEERKKAVAAKRELASHYGGHSDHLAIVAAFHRWKDAKKNGESKEFCSQYFVSSKAMKRLDNMREKLQAELERHGLIPRNDSNCSLNAHDPGILRAVVAVGLYPMVGRRCSPSGNNRRALVEIITGAKVRVPSLSNMSSREDDKALIVFDEITRGDWDVQIRASTILPTIPLLLFAGEIAVAPTESCDADKSDDEEDNKVETVGDVMDIDKAGGRPGDKIMHAPENSVKVVVDRWLPFEMTAIETAQMYILKERLVASILFKVKHPQKNLPPHLGASMYAIACILSFDGLSKLSIPTVDVEPTASAVDATGLRADPNSTMGESLLSNLADGNKLLDLVSAGNKLLDLVSAPSGAASAVKEPEKKRSRSKKRKSTNMDSGNMEADLNTASDEAASAVEEPVKKKRRMSKTQKSAKNLNLANGKPEVKPANESDLGNMKESLPSNLVNGNEQPDTNIAPAETASAVEKPVKKRRRSKKQKSAKILNLANGKPEVKPANESDLGNMKESLPSNLVNGNEQPDTNITPAETASAVEKPAKKRRRSKKQKSAKILDLANGKPEVKPANESDLVNMKESLPSNLVNGNEQHDTNIAPAEAASAVEKPVKKRRRSKKQKSAKILDLDNEQPEVKAANESDLGNMKESLPSNLVNGNEQPDTNIAPAETASAVEKPVKKRRRSKKQKSANNLDLANEQAEVKPANESDLGMKVSLPSNLVNGNEQPDTNIAPAEAASAGEEPVKKRSKSSKKRRSAKKLDLGNMEVNKPSDLPNNGNAQTEVKSASQENESIPADLANGNAQPDANIAQMEAASAAKKPGKKQSSSKRRKLANNLSSGSNMEENVASTINSDPTEAA